HRQKPWPHLAANLARCRVLIIPSANPDGRARCPLDSWVGVNEKDISINEVGMGVRRDRHSYTWPSVKQIHPMRPPSYRSVGAYFNDDGVNLMHDEWMDPMAAETCAFLKLVRAEAPDFIASLHSHSVPPSVEPISSVYIKSLTPCERRSGS